jgi:hypothetical protein
MSCLASHLNLAKENYDMRNLGYRNDMYIIVVPGLYHYYLIPHHYLPRLISLLFHSFSLLA